MLDVRDGGIHLGRSRSTLEYREQAIASILFASIWLCRNWFNFL